MRSPSLLEMTNSECNKSFSEHHISVTKRYRIQNLPCSRTRQSLQMGAPSTQACLKRHNRHAHKSLPLSHLQHKRDKSALYRKAQSAPRTTSSRLVRVRISLLTLLDNFLETLDHEEESFLREETASTHATHVLQVEQTLMLESPALRRNVQTQMTWTSPGLYFRRRAPDMGSLDGSRQRVRLPSLLTM